MAHILIVDDEAVYRKNLAFLLETEGHDVQTAATGAEAIDLAHAMTPHLLIADWRLRGSITGLDVVETLSRAYLDLLTIMITGFAAEDLAPEAHDLRIARVLEKPFGLNDLRDAVHEILATDMAPPNRM